MSTSSSIRSAARRLTALSRYSSLEVFLCLRLPGLTRARPRDTASEACSCSSRLPQRVWPRIADLLDAGQLTTHVGEVLPFAEARLAHAMLAGKPHKRGKIVLVLEA